MSLSDSCIIYALGIFGIFVFSALLFLPCFLFRTFPIHLKLTYGILCSSSFAWLLLIIAFYAP